MNKQSKTKYLILFIVLAVAAVGITIFFAGSKGRALKKPLDLGHRYLLEADYEQALVCFNEAIEIDPTCVDAYLGIADVYIAQGNEAFDNGDLKQAKSLYESALDAITVGLSHIEDERLHEKEKEINEKITLVIEEEERLIKEEIRRREEQVLKAIEDLNYVCKIEALFELFEDEDSGIILEPYLLTTGQAGIRYGEFENVLDEYIHLLYDNRDLSILDKYFTKSNLDNAKSTTKKWYHIGCVTVSDYPDFWRACELIIYCLQYQNKLDKVLEIKKLAEDAMGDSFFMDGWKYSYSTPYGYYLETYNKYDLLVESYNDMDSETVFKEYDDSGNLVRHGSTDGSWTKELIYDDNNRMTEFFAYYDGDTIPSQHTLHEYEDIWPEDVEDIYFLELDKTGNLEFTIHSVLDQYGFKIMVAIIEPNGESQFFMDALDSLETESAIRSIFEEE